MTYSYSYLVLVPPGERTMKIIKYDSDARFTDIIKIFELSRQKYWPDNPAMTEEMAKLQIKTHWSNTVLERDVLIAITDEGKVIGVVGLYKPKKEGRWNVLMDVIPDYETEDLWNEMITAILKLAKEQNAPELRFRMTALRPTLTQALKTLNITPHHHIYSLNLENLDDIPKVSMPKGITIESASTIIGKNQYISVMNEAYKDIEEWTPDTEENIREAEAMDKKRNVANTYYLAYEGKTMVGACHVAEPPTNQHIGGLGVPSKYQKKGIGEALMFKALQGLKMRGQKDVKWFVSGTDTGDIKLPVKFGFQEMPARSIKVFSFNPKDI